MYQYTIIIDGLIGSNSITEIKCPYSVKDSDTLEQALQEKKLPYISEKNGVYQLRKDHHYYFQIQGQMHITERHKCYFFIYTPEWTHLEIIHYDDVFWSKTMEKKLKLFYEECLLREIIDPQYYKRLMKISVLCHDYVVPGLRYNRITITAGFVKVSAMLGMHFECITLAFSVGEVELSRKRYSVQEYGSEIPRLATITIPIRLPGDLKQLGGIE
ncbi:uncharacterized protein LOC107885888 [Acyrthosiphon pisum]|uniref:Uncharacterized protein n=1 Tax=Acyrthosiphon pisum TaxID=7029 RepID=A0A8R2HCH7_ACYPI|nr:uncharacterized protein LOC107885888 [Acyrthosiphon pisum]|eukprot:XP_016665113.1 PREDICTED: uncharacterized protein LOC107885888 [Acyrthosiphon pisum]